MNILIVKAHPRANGFTHQIAETYKKKQEWLGNTVEILDLYSAENTQSYPEFVDDKHLLMDATTERMQSKIIWADEIVIVFPVWWFDCPAIMKNWFDRNFTGGFAFKHEKWGKLSKLLAGKKWKVFATADGPGWALKMIMYIPMVLWRFGYVGIKTTAFKVFGNARKKTAEQKQQFLKNL